jgi:hypothetical protein
MLIITQPNRAEIYHVYIIVKQSQQYYAKLNNVRCRCYNDGIVDRNWRCILALCCHPCVADINQNTNILVAYSSRLIFILPYVTRP